MTTATSREAAEAGGLVVAPSELGGFVICLGGACVGMDDEDFAAWLRDLQTMHTAVRRSRHGAPFATSPGLPA